MVCKDSKPNRAVVVQIRNSQRRNFLNLKSFCSTEQKRTGLKAISGRVPALPDCLTRNLMSMSLLGPPATIWRNSIGVTNGLSVALPSATLKRLNSGAKIGSIVKKSRSMRRNDSVYRRKSISTRSDVPQHVVSQRRDAVHRDALEH